MVDNVASQLYVGIVWLSQNLDDIMMFLAIHALNSLISRRTGYHGVSPSCVAGCPQYQSETDHAAAFSD